MVVIYTHVVFSESLQSLCPMSWHTTGRNLKPCSTQFSVLFLIALFLFALMSKTLMASNNSYNSECLLIALPNSMSLDILTTLKSIFLFWKYNYRNTNFKLMMLHSKLLSALPYGSSILLLISFKLSPTSVCVILAIYSSLKEYQILRKLLIRRWKCQWMRQI